LKAVFSKNLTVIIASKSIKKKEFKIFTLTGPTDEFSFF
jgi:hypothetical protein